MSRALRETFLGIFIGLIGNVIGFVLFGLAITLINDGVTFQYFCENMFLKTDVFKSQVLTGALLINVILFYIFMRRGSDGINRGIIITILLSVIGIVYFYA